MTWRALFYRKFVRWTSPCLKQPASSWKSSSKGTLWARAVLVFWLIGQNYSSGCSVENPNGLVWFIAQPRIESNKTSALQNSFNSVKIKDTWEARDDREGFFFVN